MLHLVLTDVALKGCTKDASCILTRYASSDELYIFAKEPYIPAKEPYISAIEHYVCVHPPTMHCVFCDAVHNTQRITTMGWLRLVGSFKS